MAARGNRITIGSQFIAHRVEMLESPAWRVLSLSARRVIDRIEIEHAAHGGFENGQLPVTYDDFHKFGMDRHSIGPGIREAIALGFLDLTVKGRAGNAEHRSPNKFRLTYLHTHRARRPIEPTDDWKRLANVNQAKAAAQAARPATFGKKRIPVGKTPIEPVGETPTETAPAPMGESLTTGKVEKPTLLSISRKQGTHVSEITPARVLSIARKT